ncbi:hypothetical protein bwei_1691 [Bacillus mycoides]|nr:hypothetical protein bwei_1691 [Bacillus mycoides]
MIGTDYSDFKMNKLKENLKNVNDLKNFSIYADVKNINS